MGVLLYVYHMKDGFAYMGMIQNVDELKKKGHRTLVDVVIAPTEKLAGNYRENITKEYNMYKTKIDEMKINLDNIQAECQVSCVSCVISKD